VDRRRARVCREYFFLVQSCHDNHISMTCSIFMRQHVTWS
jgi:hypothetical protein